MLRLLVVERPPQNLVGWFCDHQPVAGCKRQVRVGTAFDVLDQLGIEQERFAIESGKFNHVALSCFSFSGLPPERHQLVK